MARKKLLSRKAVLIALFFMLIAIIYLIFRQFNPSLGFQYFEPGYLPPNVTVKEKRVGITLGHVDVEQNFRTEDWVYAISEDKADSSSSIGTANQNYNEKSVKPTCSILNTPTRVQYRICHWIDYGRIDVHEVTFIKNGTNIYSQIPTTTQQEISLAQIEKFIDSFHQESTLGFPVLRSNGA